MPDPKTPQLVHLTMGEIVIPPEVLTPALMDELRRIYRAEGLDFERYVVGGPVGPDGDSLNPVTGLREYFDSAEDSVADNEAAWGGLDDDLGGGGAGNESYPADNDENNTRADELRSIAAEAAYNAAHAGRSASETGDDSRGDYAGDGGDGDSRIREAETRTNDPATLGETRQPGVTPGITPPGQQDARIDPSQPPGIGPNRTATQDDRPFAQSAQGPGANLGPQDPDKTGQRTNRSGQPAAPGTTATQTVTRTGPASGRSLGRAPGGQGADASTGGGGGRTANRSGDPSADPASPDYKAGSVGAARGMEAEAYDFVSMYSERNSGLIGWTAEDVDRVAAEMRGESVSEGDKFTAAMTAMNKGYEPGTPEFYTEFSIAKGNLNPAYTNKQLQDLYSDPAAPETPKDASQLASLERDLVHSVVNVAKANIREQMKAIQEVIDKIKEDQKKGYGGQTLIDLQNVRREKEAEQERLSKELENLDRFGRSVGSFLDERMVELIQKALGVGMEVQLGLSQPVVPGYRNPLTIPIPGGGGGVGRGGGGRRSEVFTGKRGMESKEPES